MAKRKKSRKRKPSTRRPSRSAFYPPGVSDLVCTDKDLRHPDVAKFKYAEYVAHKAPGAKKLARFERAFKRGPLGIIPEIDHWAMEEFFWHGVPGDNWHPMEAYLSFVGDRLSPAGHEQLRRWKEARIGFYEIGKVVGDVVFLQEWDPARRAHVGEAFRAVTPGIGGAGFLRSYRGKVQLTYVAPWVPDRGLYCAMGYGMMLPKEDVGITEVLLGLRQPAIVARPIPWNRSPALHRQYVREWNQRDWMAWLDERLEFPFRALAPIPPASKPQEVIIDDLVRHDRQAVRQFGVYVSTKSPAGLGIYLIGLTNVIPLDITASNWWTVAEYGAYREHVGPPPGTLRQPRFTPRRY